LVWFGFGMAAWWVFVGAVDVGETRCGVATELDASLCLLCLERMYLHVDGDTDRVIGDVVRCAYFRTYM
jgi:hypothetical protein